MAAIVIEGGDGCGKSSLCAELAKRMDGVVLSPSSMPALLPGVRSLMTDDPKTYLLPRLVYYLSANQLVANSALEYLNRGGCVIFDRYVYSTYATHVVLDEIHYAGAHKEQIEALVREAGKSLITPDVVIFLQANEAERFKRLQRRDQSQNHKIDWDSDFVKRVDVKFGEIASTLTAEGRTEVIKIDSSDMGMEQTVSQALRSLEASGVKIRKEVTS